jgi:NAD(P)-dependent dehydrogenase (short-subunit alcohol dehydrogenase family)
MPALRPSADEYLASLQPAQSRRLRNLVVATGATSEWRSSQQAAGSIIGGSPVASADGQALAGKSVLVTGGGTGIGQGIVLAFAAEGAHVIATGRRVAPLDETVALASGMSGSVEAVVADIADRDQTALIAGVVEKYGALDILVNNAGMNIPKRSLAELSIEDWHNVVDTNLHGTFHVVHAALPVMRAQGDGLIINVSSISGKRTISDLAGAAYCASKFVS